MPAAVPATWTVPDATLRGTVVTLAPTAVPVLWFVPTASLTGTAQFAPVPVAATWTGAASTLAATGAALTIDVSDDGSGFGIPARGIGLTNSRDRVEALGGRLRIDSRPGAGTRLHAELPVAGHG